MPAPTRLTYQDFVLFPDDGKRHEIIGGEHHVTPSPGTRHQRASRNLLFLLERHLRRTRAGEVFSAPFDVLLSDEDVVEPDLLYVSAAKASIIGDKNVEGAPDLVVEIVSESTRKTDETVKRKLYERRGVREYWILDAELETVRVRRRGAKGFGQPVELSREAEDRLRTPLLPGFEAPLSEIFG